MNASSNRPDRHELNAMLRESLTAMISQVDGAMRFELRVALRTLDILERQAELGDAVEHDECERLSRLLSHTGPLEELRSTLCTRLRDGQIRYDSPQLLTVLRANVLARLSIDNPSFKPLANTGAKA